MIDLIYTFLWPDMDDDFDAEREERIARIALEKRLAREAEEKNHFDG